MSSTWEYLLVQSLLVFILGCFVTGKKREDLNPCLAPLRGRTEVNEEMKAELPSGDGTEMKMCLHSVRKSVNKTCFSSSLFAPVS